MPLTTEKYSADSLYPLDAELFGPSGAAAKKLCVDLTRDAQARQYGFLRNEVFAQLTDPRRQQQIYWQEVFLRAHWGAVLNLLRHERWQAGCVLACQQPANFFSFAANLRGLIEGALDAQYSLGAVPMTLAENYATIQLALQGKLFGALLCPDVEDRLIHFVYARKLERREHGIVPASHQSLEPKDYRNGLGLPDEYRDRFRQLYDQLCGFCHPTAIGLGVLWETLPTGAVRVTAFDDRAAIKTFYEQHNDAIQFALSLSVTTSALCFRTMNRFAFPEVRCERVEQWNFTDIPAWRKVEEKIGNA